MKNEQEWKEIHELFEESAKKASVKYQFDRIIIIIHFHKELKKWLPQEFTKITIKIRFHLSWSEVPIQWNLFE